MNRIKALLAVIIGAAIALVSGYVSFSLSSTTTDYGAPLAWRLISSSPGSLVTYNYSYLIIDELFWATIFIVMLLILEKRRR